MKSLLFTILFLFLAFPSKAQAEAAHALAMHGPPKYGPEATHLDYANPDAPKGGTLKQAAIGTFDTLNPFSIKGKAAEGLDGLFYPRLMARVWDEPFSLYPYIAEKVEVPDDRSSITFYLNPKAVFHDGSPITADDILFSYETLMQAGRPNQRRIYKLASPEKIDERTVKFSFSEGYDQETALIMAIMPILSKTWWQAHDFEGTILDTPVSAGPYRIESIDAGRQITYKRIDNHWAADLLAFKGHYNFDRIVFEYYRDSDVALQAFKSGDLNFRREWDAGNWNSNYSDIQDNSLIKLEELDHGRPDRVRAFIFNTRRPPFDNIKVREALQLTFDFDWMNQNLFHGEYKQINSFYPNTDLSYVSSLPSSSSLPPSSSSRGLTTGSSCQNEQDPGWSLSSAKAEGRDDACVKNLRARMKTANNLLNDAGWTLKDGKRVNANGKPFTFEILLDNPNNEKIALSLTRNLKKLGIDARVRPLDTAAFRGRLNEYDFDMALYYWLSSLSPGTEQYLYWSCEAADQPARWNFAGICDPAIDRLSQEIAQAKTREGLIQSTRALDKKLLETRPMIPLYYNPKDFVASRDGIRRPATSPLYGLVVETWWYE